eukprot:CAMPEP_0185747002 /NCGR_PEP_ID=MMETSP1174-20130828/5674_1 /TAXON_ID=35687 /ORGANISM="Dictyocha speculum, Strain CCMP1381" /LENGTH=401 /DNA_ID=CAMNT_0028422005 /DNA_START=77 /DNA_END=1283 /DNA_ORIENTATION=-
MEQNQRTNLAIRVLLLLLASHNLFVFLSNTIKETHPGVVVVSNIKETVPSSVVELLAYNNRALRANKLYARGLHCSETDNDHGEKVDGLGSFHGETEIADSPMKSSKFLDFYIMGFPKCGTSSLMHLFKEIVNETDIIYMDDGTQEYAMSAMENVKRLLEKIEEGRNDTNSEVKKYGVKWPGGLHKEFFKSMSNLMELNPQHEETKLIIGMRHPVRLFESYWNYRELVHHNMPPPSTLIGSSKVGSQGVYTEIGQFEKYLMQLGKFSLRKDDYAWLSENDKVVLPTKNKIYLYLQEQFQDENVTRFQKFLDDLLSFAGVGEAKVTPDDFPHNNVVHKVKPFNICDEEHKAVRDVLLAGGKATANWFQRNLENSRDIYVSDREFFLSLVNTWGQDPCVSGKE